MVCQQIRRLRLDVLPADSLAQVSSASARCRDFIPKSRNNTKTVPLSRSPHPSTPRRTPRLGEEEPDQNGRCGRARIRRRSARSTRGGASATHLRVEGPPKPGNSSARTGISRRQTRTAATIFLYPYRLDRVQKPISAADSLWFVSPPCTLVSDTSCWRG